MKNKLPIKRKQKIGERFRAIRKSLRLEQTELAKDMGISQAIISQYEKGMTEIPLSVLEYLKKTWHIERLCDIWHRRDENCDKRELEWQER
jgi:transcriptional regulator with XRE-family HTH domain